MTAALGDNSTIAASPTTRTQLGAEYRGKVRAIYDTYEAASLATGSTIVIGKARAGEVFLGGKLVCDDLSSAGTISVGDADSAARFLAATVETTAGQATEMNAIGGLGYKFTADTDILLTTATEEMTGTIKTVIYLACPN